MIVTLLLIRWPELIQVQIILASVLTSLTSTVEQLFILYTKFKYDYKSITASTLDFMRLFEPSSSYTLNRHNNQNI